MAAEDGLVSIKMDARTYREAKAAAALRGIPVSQYLRELVWPAARAEIERYAGKSVAIHSSGASTRTDQDAVDVAETAR